MATKGFTKIDNSIIFDNNLSLEAIGLYIKLKYLSGIDGFKLKRDHIKFISGYGETAFRRVWKELKDKGILIETKLRVNGRYEYTFTLINSEPVKKKGNDPVENKHKKIKDSDGNNPLEGQMSVYDMPIEESSIEVVANETGFTKEESKETLRVANNDIKEVLKYYRYTLQQSNVKSIYHYTRKCIMKKYKLPRDNIRVNKGSFNNFEQREYDVDKLERALLYGEPYELPV